MLKRTIAVVSVLATFAFYGTALAKTDKVLLCHHTSSAKNPFVLINVSVNSLDGHANTNDFPAQGTTVESCLLGPGDGGGNGGPN